jgi:hypothetical protein
MLLLDSLSIFPLETNIILEITDLYPFDSMTNFENLVWKFAVPKGCVGTVCPLTSVSRNVPRYHTVNTVPYRVELVSILRQLVGSARLHGWYATV